MYEYVKKLEEAKKIQNIFLSYLNNTLSYKTDNSHHIRPITQTSLTASGNMSSRVPTANRPPTGRRSAADRCTERSSLHYIYIFLQ